MASSPRTQEARKLYNRIDARARRLEARGLATADLGKFRQIERLRRGEEASGAYLNKLRKLDRARGLRVSAGKSTAIAETRQLKRIADAAYRNRSSKAMLRRTAQLMKDVGTARLSVARTHSSDSAHLRKVAGTIESIKPTSRTSQAALRTMVAAGSRIIGYESLTKEAAESAMTNAIAVFGDSYLEWTPDQRSAVWNEFSKLKESLGSPIAMQILGVKARVGAVDFLEDKDGFVKAVFGDTPEGSATARAREEVYQDLVRRIESPRPSEEDIQDAFSTGRSMYDMMKATNAAIRKFRI